MKHETILNGHWTAQLCISGLAIPTNKKGKKRQRSRWLALQCTFLWVLTLTLMIRSMLLIGLMWN